MERNKIKSECQYIKHKDNRLIYKCKNCDDISTKPTNGLTEMFSKTYKFCNKGLHKFVLLLRKSVYPYEYMDCQERFDEIELPHQIELYSELSLENITDGEYVHAKKVWDTFNIKNMGEYHDIYVQLDTLLLI